MSDSTVGRPLGGPRMLAGVRRRAVLPFLLVGSLLAACGSVDHGITATRSQRNDTTPGASTPDTGGTAETTPGTEGTTPPGTASEDTTFDTKPAETTISIPADQKIIDFGSSKKPEPYDGFLIAAFQDIESFWTAQMPATFGKPFEPLKGGIFADYPSRKEAIPGCGTPQTKYSDVQGNAFYCSDGDFIVYDDDQLLPQLVDELGQSAVGVVLAHEFGHAIQARNGEFAQPTILKEQQADCFAGAWAAHISRGEAKGLTFGDKETKDSLIAMIQVRDPPNGNVNDPDAHGTGFDRVGAFQDGFIGGTKRCKTFFTEDRQKNLIDIPAVFGESGNLPFIDPSGKNDDIVTLIPADLDRFWVDKLNGVEGVTFTAPKLDVYPDNGPFPACDGAKATDFKRNIFFCKSANEIMIDQDFAEQLAGNELFGDLSVGYLIGEGYSEAIQQALGSTLTGKKRVLLNDCFTGAWVADDIPVGNDPKAGPRGGGQLTLSAGDLDEAIVTALKRSDNTSDEDKRGTAFEKIDNFRAGVLGGIDACRQRLD